MIDLRAVTVSDGAQPVVTGGPFDDDFWAQVTSNFGPRLPIVTRVGTTGDFHYGTDFWRADIDGVNLHALAGGPVMRTGWESCGPGTGWSIRVGIGFRGGGDYFEFFHMAEASPVVFGEVVLKGRILGQVDNTGASTGAHLHVGIFMGGQYVDPIEVFRAQQSALVPAVVPEPAAGDAGPLPSIHTNLELQYVFGKGTTVTGGEVSWIPEDRLLQVEGQINVAIPAGMLVRRYTVDVPVTPDVAWIGR